MSTTHFLNVDLDVESHAPLALLTQAFRIRKLDVLHERNEDGLRFAVYETSVFAPGHKGCTADDPNLVVSVLLAAIEGLPEKAKTVWDACTKRDFNLGFACGTAPSAFTSALSLDTLKRIAEVGASVTVTLYPVGLPQRNAPRTGTRRRRTSTRRSDHLR